MLMNPKCLLAVALLGSAFSRDSAAAPFYWTDPGSFAIGADLIRRANSDGSGMQTIVSGLEEPRGMALDLGNGKLYWADLGARAISRTNLDGTGLETFATAHDGAGDVAIDALHGKVYWTDSDVQQIHIGGHSGQIWRADMDGSNLQNVAGGMVQPGAVDVDAVHGKVYWTELEQKNDGIGSIQRSNLDGTDRETLLTGVDESTGLAIDAIQGKMYWTEATTHRIQSANLDGTSVTDVLTGIVEPTQIDLNLSEGKIYWTTGGGPGVNAILRANLDGSGVETLVSGVGAPFGIAVTPEPSSVVLAALGLVGLVAWFRRQLRPAN